MSPYEALKVVARVELGQEAASVWCHAIEEAYTDDALRLAALKQQLDRRAESKALAAQEAESQRAWKEGRPQRPQAPPPPAVAPPAPQRAPRAASMTPTPAPADAGVVQPPEPASRIAEIRLLIRSSVPGLLGLSTTATWVVLLAAAKQDRTLHKGMRDIALMTGGNRSTTDRDVRRLRELGAIGRPYAGRRTGEPGKRRAATYSVHPVTADLIQTVRERVLAGGQDDGRE